MFITNQGLYNDFSSKPQFTLGSWLKVLILKITSPFSFHFKDKLINFLICLFIILVLKFHIQIKMLVSLTYSMCHYYHIHVFQVVLLIFLVIVHILIVQLNFAFSNFGVTFDVVLLFIQFAKYAPFISIITPPLDGQFKLKASYVQIHVKQKSLVCGP